MPHFASGSDFAVVMTGTTLVYCRRETHAPAFVLLAPKSAALQENDMRNSNRILWLFTGLVLGVTGAALYFRQNGRHRSADISRQRLQRAP